jgi:hypothetical protein
LEGSQLERARKRNLEVGVEEKEVPALAGVFRST